MLEDISTLNHSASESNVKTYMKVEDLEHHLILTQNAIKNDASDNEELLKYAVIGIMIIFPISIMIGMCLRLGVL